MPASLPGKSVALSSEYIQNPTISALSSASPLAWATFVSQLDYFHVMLWYLVIGLLVSTLASEVRSQHRSQNGLWKPKSLPVTDLPTVPQGLPL